MTLLRISYNLHHFVFGKLWIIGLWLTKFAAVRTNNHWLEKCPDCKTYGIRTPLPEHDLCQPCYFKFLHSNPVFLKQYCKEHALDFVEVKHGLDILHGPTS